MNLQDIADTIKAEIQATSVNPVADVGFLDAKGERELVVFGTWEQADHAASVLRKARNLKLVDQFRDGANYCLCFKLI